MASKRTFYRNVITVEILSEEPLSGEESLSDIEYLIDQGPCSGKVETTTANERVDGRRMAQLLAAQGSDTEFFGLDEGARTLTAMRKSRTGTSPPSAHIASTTGSPSSR